MTAVIKHHGHEDGSSFLKKEGTDTSRLMETKPFGLTFLSGNEAIHHSAESMTLHDWVMFYQVQQRYDVLLVEGFKQAGYMKVVFHRSEDDDVLLSTLENIQYVLTADSAERLRKLTDIPVYERGEMDELIEQVALDIGGK